MTFSEQFHNFRLYITTKWCIFQELGSRRLLMAEVAGECHFGWDVQRVKSDYFT